jgi:hypothetical protein
MEKELDKLLSMDGNERSPGSSSQLDMLNDLSQHAQMDASDLSSQLDAHLSALSQAAVNQAAAVQQRKIIVSCILILKL